MKIIGELSSSIGDYADFSLDSAKDEKFGYVVGLGFLRPFNF